MFSYLQNGLSIHRSKSACTNMEYPFYPSCSTASSTWADLLKSFQSQSYTISLVSDQMTLLTLLEVRNESNIPIGNNIPHLVPWSSKPLQFHSRVFNSCEACFMQYNPAVVQSSCRSSVSFPLNTQRPQFPTRKDQEVISYLYSRWYYKTQCNVEDPLAKHQLPD